MAYLYEACDQISKFLPSIVAEKNVTKNILDGQKDRGTEVKQYIPPPEGQTDRGKTVYPPSGGAMISHGQIHV